LADRCISLTGVEVHNLKSVDLRLPYNQLIVFCGVSGSGKSSMALDTLYAEGQRRYIESFSAYTRQFLERLEKPAAERIEGIPPAIAVTRDGGSRSSRSTVGTATEVADHMRLLFAKIGQPHCHQCSQLVTRDTPQTAADHVATLAEGTRYLVAFPLEVGDAGPTPEQLEQLQRDGFVRLIVGQRMLRLDEPIEIAGDPPRVLVVVDRLVTGPDGQSRLLDSLEMAFARGDGHCEVLAAVEETSGSAEDGTSKKGRVLIDDKQWQRLALSTQLQCMNCQIEFPDLEPRLFSFNSPLGACSECEGFGNLVDVDMELVVPNPKVSLRDGAIAPWNTPAYAHELEEILALAEDYDLPVDVPFDELTDTHLELIKHGVEEREFGGLDGFFAWLERRKYKMHIRVFLSRWRSYRTCPACGGARLRPEALAVRISGKNIAELSQLKIIDLVAWLDALELTPWEETVARTMRSQVVNRVGFLDTVGLGYLSLDRTLRTLSGGESQRVSLTSALGSSLVNMLYVLDEPSVGLHPRDVDRLTASIKALRDRGNTVVVTEHEESMIRAADQVVEFGPEAGERGGRIVYQGSFEKLLKSTSSTTADFLTGRRGRGHNTDRRPTNYGWIRLAGARGHNLQNLTVEFPLGVLCVISGVSGSGKSTLVQHTLYPALCRRMRKDSAKPSEYDDVLGDGQLDDVLLVDQSPIGRSPRSNPVTYVKAFDAMRSVFADTVDARTRNYTASHFSFNVDGGRCPKCKGDGFLTVDMQFLADVYLTCPECNGKRYRREILDVLYRGRNIADVLKMTVREAFTFFRNHTQVQQRLKKLIDVGLDYLRLGQPANTLSGGEAQRLKLATYMASTRRGRCLFLLDEPTTGLHFSDVSQLIDCFESLLSVGHSLIVVEHNLQLMKAADYLIDLGPGAADEGGAIVARGTPEEIARNKDSITGKFLAEVLAADISEQSS
jgi:excinuclease ABC subunit A